MSLFSMSNSFSILCLWFSRFKIFILRNKNIFGKDMNCFTAWWRTLILFKLSRISKKLDKKYFFLQKKINDIHFFWISRRLRGLFEHCYCLHATGNSRMTIFANNGGKFVYAKNVSLAIRNISWNIRRI